MIKLVSPVFAQNTCTPGTGGVNLGDCIKLEDGTPVSEKYNSVAFLVNLLVDNLFVVAGIILFAMILFGGVGVIVKGGKEGLESGRKILTAVVLGFLIMFSAYWIVQLIIYITGTDILL